MPLYCFKCPNEHKITKFKVTPYKRKRKNRCKECGLYLARDYEEEMKTGKTKEIHLDYSNDPISHLSKKRSFKGIMIENLTPQPVFVRTERQYHKLLKATHSLEKGR